MRSGGNVDADVVAGGVYFVTFACGLENVYACVFVAVARL